MRRAALLLALGILLVACVQSTPSATLPPFASPTPAEPLAGSPTAGELLTTNPATETSAPITSEVQASPSPDSPTALPGLPGVMGVTWGMVLEGLESPIGVTNAGDGSGRLFIIEQAGRIRIIQDGVLLTVPFLDIVDRVDCCGERGLLGLAFHPEYPQNGYFYVNYTTILDGQLTTIIARYQVSGDPNFSEPATEKVLLSQPQPYPNHNGGGLAFGPDGTLYIALGDGGSGGDPEGNAQNLNTWLGKLLRIDVNNGDPYAIPLDNPFAGGGGLPEIWAYGLRNPWRFSFDRLTGDLYIGDVGQGSWEEIDYQPAGSPGGENYGWDYYEGNHPYEGTPPPGVEFVFPVAEYPHGPDVSVTGGYVYRGAALPAWNGVYLYGDYASGRVRGLVQLEDGNWQNEILFELNAQITSFGEDETGELYLTDYNGRLLRFEIADQTYLPIVVQPVTFAVLGDYGMANQPEADVAALIASWQPDIILTTGDNNYPDGTAETIDENIGQFFSDHIYPYQGDYGEGALYNRFFPSIGNHDWITDRGQPYLDYFSLPGNERYYDFTWGPVHYFALNNDSNEPDGVHSTSTQGQWLQERLAASTLPWQVVYMHYPAYSSGYHGSTNWAQWPYAAWGADAVLAGHDHTYERLIVDGIPYFVVGLGGGPIYPFFGAVSQSVMRYNDSHGALWAQATESKLAFRFIAVGGEVVDVFEIEQ